MCRKDRCGIMGDSISCEKILARKYLPNFSANIFSKICDQIFFSEYLMENIIFQSQHKKNNSIFLEFFANYRISYISSSVFMVT